MDVLVLCEVKITSYTACHDLTQHCCGRRARDAQFWETEKAEDHDRVKDDVDDGAGRLGDHTVKCPSRGLQQALESDLENGAEGHAQTDLEINRAVLLHHCILNLRADKRPRSEESDQQEEDISEEGQKQTVIGSRVRPVKPALTERFRQKGIDADTCSGCKRDQSILHRKGKRDRCQSIFRKPGDKHTVHDIIECLHQHRYHHRK